MIVATNLVLAPTGAKRGLVCIGKQVLISREGNKFGATRICYPFYRRHADCLQRQEHLPGQDPLFLPGEELLNFQPSETPKAWLKPNCWASAPSRTSAAAAGW